MASPHQRVFEENVQKREAESEYTQSFTREALDATITGLDGWDGLTGPERSQRGAAYGKGKKLYKMSKRFCVVDIVGADGADGDDEKVLVERRKDGSIPAVEDYRRVVPTEDWFDTLKEHHEEGGHCKGRVFDNRVHGVCRGIPRWVLEVSLTFAFLHTCH